MARPIALPEPWKSLARENGGVCALASLLGTTPRTLYRWAHGKPNKQAQIIIDSLKIKED